MCHGARVDARMDREGKWRLEPAMRQGRIFHAAAATGNNLYALGGCDYSGEALGSVEVLDVRTGAWRPTGSLQVNRTYLSAVVVF